MRSTRILETIGQRSFPLFAVLDAARASIAFPRLKSAGAKVLPLYLGKELEELKEVCPYLVELAANPKVLELLLDAGWGRSWGIFLTSERPSEVYTHLQKFIKVKTEDGEQRGFRFYDPRVLRIYLPTCTPAETAKFFGPIQSFWMEDEDPNTCLVFRQGNKGAVKDAIDLRKTNAMFDKRMTQKHLDRRTIS